MARILIVDDDPAIARTLQRIVDSDGHESLVASSGREALEVLDRIAVSLLITDINMRDIDGIELILALQEQDDPPPVIAISGGGVLDSDTLLTDAGALGAERTIAKPFEVADIRSCVSHVLAASGDRAD